MTIHYSKSKRAIQRRVYHHVINKTHTFFAVVQPPFEQCAYKELTSLGINGCTVTKGGIAFRGTLQQCYMVNYYSRIITRVLMRIIRFRAYHFNEIYRTLKSVPWELYIPDGATIDVEVSVHKSKLHHTKRIADEVVKAITKRLSMFDMHCNTNNTIQSIFVRFDHDECMVSLDSSGEALYKRGYKQYISEAPLRETIAAALLYECNIEEYDVIIDPMCGSGTFPIEAWCICYGKPPGAMRTFSFMQWPSYREYLFRSVIANQSKNFGQEVTVIAGDKEHEMVEITKRNSVKAHAQISVYHGDFLKDKLHIKGKNVLCVVNPPYGKRINSENTAKLYERLAYVLKNWYPNWSFCVLIPTTLRKAFRMDVDKDIQFLHGGLRITALIGYRGR